MSGYSMTTKIKSEIGGDGLLKIIESMVENFDAHMSPFHVLGKEDFANDPIVNALEDMGGIPKMITVLAMPEKQAKIALAEIHKKLKTVKLSAYRMHIRTAYNAIQNALDSDNEAVKLERVASNSSKRSSGYWQIEALNQIDSCMSYASEELSEFVTSRKLIMSGSKDNYVKVAGFLKDLYEIITPQSNKRFAYTTLNTQDNEPYLLCPKGFYNGHTAAIPMEVSKCRFNCIDSRVSKDGVVSCAYQDWLKVAFESQEKVNQRLNVHRSPDNEANRLELKEGERSIPLTENEIPIETRFDKNVRGYERDKKEFESLEKMLDNAKVQNLGHRDLDKDYRTKLSQTDHTKTVENQLPRTGENSESINALLDKLNKKEFHTDETIETNLARNEWSAQKGEAEESYPHQLNDNKKLDEIYMRILNKDAGDGDDMSVSQHLNKTAKKEKDEAFDSLLADRRHHEKIDQNIEALLSDDDYHQFSEEDLKHFASELGLDSYLDHDNNLEF
jgi:hypothetical protein